LFFALLLVGHGCAAAWTANLLAATWGAGNTLLPLAAGSAHGNVLQERLIAITLRSDAVALIAATALIAWGLRRLAEELSSEYHSGAAAR
jgi:hypothetical protein